VTELSQASESPEERTVNQYRDRLAEAVQALVAAEVDQLRVERDWLLAEASDEVRERFFCARRAEAAWRAGVEPVAVLGLEERSEEEAIDG